MRLLGLYMFCSWMLLASSGWVVAADVTVRLGTATQGGGFQLYGQHLSEVLNAMQQDLHVETIATRGSTQNLADLEAGKLDIGLVEGNAARDALEGIGRAPAELTVLSVMYPNPGMFVVLAESPYHTLLDLKGKPVAFGTKASGLRILANDVLDGLGLDPTRDFEQVILDKAGDGPALVLNGRVAALWGAGIGWPGFVELAERSGGARFIAPTPAQIEQIRSKHPHLLPMRVPANTYAGQTQEIESIGLWSLILMRPDIEEGVAYQLARAIHRSETELGRRLAQAGYTRARNTLAAVPHARLHPGVVRYYREIGIMP